MRPRFVLAILIGSAIGCGGSEPAPPPVAAALRSGPHSGPAIPLPGNRGFVEVVAEVLRPASDPVIAVYFLKPDLATALTPLPTAVSIKADAGDGNPREYPLTPTRAHRPGDRAAAGRMASTPVPIDPDRFSGEIRATMAGEAFSSPFTVGR